MIDHVNLPVSDLERSKAFYQTILASLGISLLIKDGDAVGFGVNTWEFGIVQESKQLIKMHVAFIADSRQNVQKFHESALQVGGVDNGRPGLRTEYGPSYYSAYVLDPDGHNIEAVCRLEED